MAYKLTNDNRLIIKDNKAAQFLDIALDAFVLYECIDIYKNNNSVSLVEVTLLYGAYLTFMFFLFRFNEYSVFVLDEYGITRRFLIFEKHFFWETFSTKRIEDQGPHASGFVAVFSVQELKINELNQSEGPEAGFMSLNTIRFKMSFVEKFITRSRIIRFFIPEFLSVDAKLFLEKMQEWNVNIEISEFFTREVELYYMDKGDKTSTKEN